MGKASAKLCVVKGRGNKGSVVVKVVKVLANSERRVVVMRGRVS